MSEETTNTAEENTVKATKETTPKVAETTEKKNLSVSSDSGRPRRTSSFRRGSRKPRERRDRVPEFAQKIIGIRRVTRVMAGGRRFSFSVAMVLGDKKGRVGVGTGKAGDTALAIEKAMRNARKNMIKLPLTKNNSIAHDVGAKYGSSVIEIRPALGRGLVAGASLRTVLELGGVTDVTSKILSRSKNKTNIARAAIAALLKLEK